MDGKRDPNKTYYFLDIDLDSRRIIGWGTETRATVEVQLTDGIIECS